MTKAAADGVRFAGRFLFLCTDPTLLRSQLAGADLTLSEAGALRDDISTDEITPLPTMTVWDERLGRVPYLGFKAGGELPITRGAVRGGGFGITVAGRRYGKGSSREHSPMAEWHAGIRLVIAESFERIYRQNADNVGLITSTDFGLVERIRRGEAIPFDELLQGRDRLAAAIVRAGGLMRYGREHLVRERGAAAWTLPALSNARPMTLAEKIITRSALASGTAAPRIEPGAGLFVRADWRFIHEYYSGMTAHLLHTHHPRPLQVHAPESIRAFEDHMSYARRSPVHVAGGLMPTLNLMVQAHRDFVAECGLQHHGALPGTAGLPDGESGSEGISHPMMTELYALPGQLVAGTDSHTPHAGALGCLAFGVGSTDMANAFVTGAVRLVVPPTLRVVLGGTLPAGVSAKDVVLHLLALPRLRAGAGLGKLFEFTGAVVRAMNIDERATLTNMTAELGGFSGIVAPDAQTQHFLRERRGLQFNIEPWMCSDEGAPVAETMEVDCSALSPMVAAPGDPGNGRPLAQLAERPKIHIAYGGSCTGGKREDFDQYHAVLAWAAARGRRVAPGVTLYLQFGTRAVHAYCVERGYLEAFAQVGAELLMPACGACANCGPGSSQQAGEVTVSAINRNFPGRSGPGQVWLASPATVAASALAGHLASFAEVAGAAAVAAPGPQGP